MCHKQFTHITKIHNARGVLRQEIHSDVSEKKSESQATEEGQNPPVSALEPKG